MIMTGITLTKMNIIQSHYIYEYKKYFHLLSIFSFFGAKNFFSVYFILKYKYKHLQWKIISQLDKKIILQYSIKFIKLLILEFLSICFYKNLYFNFYIYSDDFWFKNLNFYQIFDWNSRRLDVDKIFEIHNNLSFFYLRTNV